MPLIRRLNDAARLPSAKGVLWKWTKTYDGLRLIVWNLEVGVGRHDQVRAFVKRYSRDLTRKVWAKSAPRMCLQALEKSSRTPIIAARNPNCHFDKITDWRGKVLKTYQKIVNISGASVDGVTKKSRALNLSVHTQVLVQTVLSSCVYRICCWCCHWCKYSVNPTTAAAAIGALCCSYALLSAAAPDPMPVLTTRKRTLTEGSCLRWYCRCYCCFTSKHRAKPLKRLSVSDWAAAALAVAAAVTKFYSSSTRHE